MHCSNDTVVVLRLCKLRSSWRLKNAKNVPSPKNILKYIREDFCYRLENSFGKWDLQDNIAGFTQMCVFCYLSLEMQQNCAVGLEGTREWWIWKHCEGGVHVFMSRHRPILMAWGNKKSAQRVLLHYPPTTKGRQNRRMTTALRRTLGSTVMYMDNGSRRDCTQSNDILTGKN
jgi:hypothetical protein